jgi:Ala-tRNA(Pro) deacylase
MATPAWIKQILEKRGVAYEEMHHRVAFTAQEVAESEHVSGNCVAKVVIVLADGRPVELIVPASRRVDLAAVRELLGAVNVHLASEAEMDRIFTDCDTGAIPPLRRWKDVTVLMDASMSDTKDLVFQAGTHEETIRLKFQDWFDLVHPLVQVFTEPEHSGPRDGFADRQDVGSEASRQSVMARAKELKREAGQPGGGQGRIDVVGHTGVYPGSGPYPEGDVPLRTPGEFVHGQRDEEGREIEGGSELVYLKEEGILLGGETPPSSGPPQSPKPVIQGHS